ncbi:MAG: hypothetical protein U0414_17995 [Polyangiaceae bacterium]
MARVLLESPLATITLDEALGVVTLERSAEPLDLERLADVAARFEVLLPHALRRELGLVFDMRRGPLASPEIEDRLFATANELQRGFRAYATVIGTAVGKLQTTRLRRENRVPQGFVATSLEAAQAHVAARIGSPKGR